MEKLISICGLICSECGAFLATQNDDDEARKKVAEEWSRTYQARIKPEDVNCVGCIQESGLVFSYCHVCEIRACGRGRKAKNCAYCQEYPCDKLKKFFELAPSAQKNLEAVRKKHENK
jgi:hypothetical protein